MSKVVPVTLEITPTVLISAELVQFITVTTCPFTGAVTPVMALAKDHPYVATPRLDRAVDVMFMVMLFNGVTTVQLLFQPVAGVTPDIVRLSPVLSPVMAVVVVTVAIVICHVPVLPGPFGPEPDGPPYLAFPVDVYWIVKYGSPFTPPDSCGG